MDVPVPAAHGQECDARFSFAIFISVRPSRAVESSTILLMKCQCQAKARSLPRYSESRHVRYRSQPCIEIECHLALPPHHLLLLPTILCSRRHPSLHSAETRLTHDMKHRHQALIMLVYLPFDVELLLCQLAKLLYVFPSCGLPKCAKGHQQRSSQPAAMLT